MAGGGRGRWSGESGDPCGLGTWLRCREWWWWWGWCWWWPWWDEWNDVVSGRGSWGWWPLPCGGEDEWWFCDCDVEIDDDNGWEELCPIGDEDDDRSPCGWWKWIWWLECEFEWWESCDCAPWLLLLLLLLLLLHEAEVCWFFCCRRQLHVVQDAGWRGIGLWIGARLDRMSFTRNDVVEFDTPPAAGAGGAGGGVSSCDVVLLLGAERWTVAGCGRKIEW